MRLIRQKFALLNSKGNFDDRDLLGFGDYWYRSVDSLRFIEHAAGKRHLEKNTVSLCSGTGKPVNRRNHVAATRRPRQ